MHPLGALCWSARQYRDRAVSTSAQHMTQGDLRAFHLTGTAIAAQLIDQFHDLPQEIGRAHV